MNNAPARLPLMTTQQKAIVSRRRVLAIGGLGLAATAIGGTAVWQLWPDPTGSDPKTPVGGAFVQPEELTSASGELTANLSAAPVRVQLGGVEASVLGYNGGLPGPTLRIRAGDRVRVSLHNGLGDPSNLHVHGLHVSPEGNSDNVFVMVQAGESFDYDYQLPDNHPPGVYWYHPHHHGFVAEQVFGGLYGAIIVEDPEPIPSARERMLVVSDIALAASGQVAAVNAMQQMDGREGDIVLVNGQVNPALSASPGERERWRIVNACVSRYLRLRLDGQLMQLLGIDSGRFENPEEVTEIVLAPGNRADLMVTAQAGSSVLRALFVDRGSHSGTSGAMTSGGMTNGGTMGGDRTGQSNGSSREIALATLVVAGSEVESLGALPPQPKPRDLRPATVTARRELVFDMGMSMGMGAGMMVSTINGRVFSGDRVDTTVAAGSVEEWTLTNTSTMAHPLHLHVWPMQLIEQNGQALSKAPWQDVVNIPARGQVRVRIAFEDFSGRTVYHCHILDHEDTGMMGVVGAR